MPWVSLCEISELTEGLGKYVEIDGFQLAVFLHKGNYHVLDNRCPHAGANLSGGHISENCVVCPWHGWQFHLSTGQLRDVPGVEVRTYPTRIVTRENLPSLLQADLPTY
jgi:nitrite reductase (NADH) small subunit